MNQTDTTAGARFDRMEYRPWLELLWRPVLIAAATVAVLLLIIVAASPSAWSILGAGRGLVPEGFYPVSGFLLVFGFTLGHAVGWAIGSFIVFYLMTLLKFGATWDSARIAMGIAYLALGPLLLVIYHILYGGSLLSMPRGGLGGWLDESHPDAHWLLIYGHPVVALAIIPLAVIFLGILWKNGERLQREATLRAALALTILASSLAIALSLTIHSMLVHARIGL